MRFRTLESFGDITVGRLELMDLATGMLNPPPVVVEFDGNRRRSFAWPSDSLDVMTCSLNRNKDWCCRPKKIRLAKSDMSRRGELAKWAGVRGTVLEVMQAIGSNPVVSRIRRE